MSDGTARLCFPSLDETITDDGSFFLRKRGKDGYTRDRIRIDIIIDFCPHSFYLSIRPYNYFFHVDLKDVFSIRFNGE